MQHISRIVGPLSLLIATTAVCNTAQAQSAEETAKQLANPTSPLSSFNFKSTYTSFGGDLPGANSEEGFLTLVQPVLPFPLDNGDQIMFRPAIPLIAGLPAFEGVGAGFDSNSGLGDIGYDLLYSTTSESGVLAGVGMIGTLPTASRDALGKDKWSAGPELFFGKVSESAVIGGLVGHQWDFAGDDDIVEDVSLTTISIFAALLPGGGWNYGTAPIITHDSVSDQWTIPINFNVGRTLVFGERPWKFNLSFNYFVEQADEFGPDWSIDFTITPVVENFMANWFK